jgi:heme exporter protein D
MSEWLAMGGYAAYVWPVYGLAAAIMLGLLIVTMSGLKKRQAEFDKLDAERRARREARHRESV